MAVKRAALFLLLVILAQGCGYGLTPGRVKPGLESVGVPYFENLTTQPGVEVALTDAIIAGIIADRTLRYTDTESADALILGSITYFKYEPVFFGSDRQANEYQVRIRCEVSLVDRASGDVIVEPTRVEGKGQYYTDEGIVGEEKARDQAGQELAQGILSLVIEEW
jgi:hypothetical protein